MQDFSRGEPGSLPRNWDWELPGGRGKPGKLCVIQKPSEGPKPCTVDCMLSPVSNIIHTANEAAPACS